MVVASKCRDLEFARSRARRRRFHTSKPSAKKTRFRARSAPVLLLGRKRGTRKSGLETNPENEAFSTLLARLWCHLSLQNPANRAENLIRLCSATIGQTRWRMAQFGAIRSRLEIIKNREKQGINREFGPLLRLIGAFLTW